MSNILDRSQAFSLNGENHEFKFTVKAIIMCEKELESHNLLTTMASMAKAPLSIGDAYTLFKWGLLGAKQYKEDEIEALFIQYIENIGMVGLQTDLLNAVYKSGLMGNAKN